MAHSASVLHPDSRFDGFLFAPVGEDGKGMIVSVVSALARLGLDPQAEAADLARLPRDRAELRLAAAVARLPDVAAAKAEPSSIAARLIALLPAAVASSGADSGPVRRPLATKYVIGWTLAVILVLAAQNFAAIERSQQQGGPASASASAAVAVTSQPTASDEK